MDNSDSLKWLHCLLASTGCGRLFLFHSVESCMCLWYYLWLLSRFSSLTLVFSNLTMIDLVGDFFIYESAILLDLWVNSTKIWKNFSHCFLKHLFFLSPHFFFFLTTSGSPVTHVWSFEFVPRVPWFLFFYSLFFWLVNLSLIWWIFHFRYYSFQF